ncbi:MAG: peptidase M17 [Flavobacteriales bacterium]|nr:peptidase M17 [Flavobacteriales bacterium]|tara:strand:+ start:508 stop:1917 length:1410 start_codon:yes stop_codon:yes gene_type:complete
MNTAIARKTSIQDTDNLVILINDATQLEGFSLSKKEMDYATKCLDTEQKNFAINQYKRWIFVQVLSDCKEKARKAANTLHASVVGNKISEVSIINAMENKLIAFAFSEGLALSNYQFLKYFSDKKEHSLKIINLCTGMKDTDAEELQAIIDGTFIARDLVNEPLSYLNAVQYSKDIESYGNKFGFSVEVLHKKKIEALKMGGLLAVNQGSIDPPTFSITEWKPPRATNKKPIVLVGKGIVYDTGGLSLKPTPNSMDLMKSDMGGSAAVVGAMAAIAKAKLNVHVIGLIPATDNRPSGNAYAPGDVITMHDGTSVEVLNTDAEGRLILADALSYAKKYDPELVIDLATLTGAAARAIGKQGIVAMGNDENTMTALKTSGAEVQERLAEFPFWDDYAEDLKSNIADLKNLGGPEAGAITAGKFLEHFTDYPYTHLDIAGPAYMLSPFNYRGKGGTGVGVRLLFNFLKKKSA